MCFDSLHTVIFFFALILVYPLETTKISYSFCIPQEWAPIQAKYILSLSSEIVNTSRDQNSCRS